MRVALLSHNARYGDAIGRQVAAKTVFFRDRGADVRVYVECAHQLHPTLDPFVQVVDAATPLSIIASDIRPCDLVSVEFGQHYRLAEVMPLLAGGRARVLFDYHGVTPPEFAAGNREALRAGQQWRGLSWFADEVIVHSRYMQRELTSAIRMPLERARVAPLWVEATSRSFTSSRYLQRRIGNDHAQVALFVGRVAPNKRISVLIEALAHLRTSFPKLHVAIVGNAEGAYSEEADRCRKLAAQLGVSDRVHLIGAISDADLAAAYASADLFVMPSVHEGFCLPVLEAMEHGVPVIAAAATALPETLSGAGLLFEPDDADDLAQQMTRVLGNNNSSSEIRSTQKVAFVVPDYGSKVLGGAERSMRSAALALCRAGWEVEVFALGSADSYVVEDGVRVWRFTAESFESCRVQETDAARILESRPYSKALLLQLQERAGEFAAIITGPYGSGLAWRVAQLLPAKTILAPCFHDEPLSRTRMVRETYRRVGGLLFHSPEERNLSHTELGVSLPNDVVMGACLEPISTSQRPVAGRRPYVLYAGRYCREKNVPLLLDWQRRYEAERPGRFDYLFAGGGDTPIPSTSPWRDLGFLSNDEKAAMIGGAAALVQLSCNESLSLVALEAWQQGVPLIGHRQCNVVAGMVERADGGVCVSNYEDFRRCLDDLLERPDAWRKFGQHGRALVRDEFESPELFVQRILEVLENASVPLVDLMHRRGRQRATGFRPDEWERFYSALVDRVLHQEPLGPNESVHVRPRGGRMTIHARAVQRKLPMEIENTGNVPVANSLLRPALLWSIVCTEGGEPAASPAATRLADWLNPGQSTPMFLKVRLPELPGEYRLGIALRREDEAAPAIGDCDVQYPLIIDDTESTQKSDSLLDRLREALAEAERLQDLPDNYTDVTTGSLAKIKQRVKQKLLHQFKTAYVDVLSRQQTDWNRQMLTVVQELAECVTLLEHTAVVGSAGDPASDLARLITRLQRGVRNAVDRIETLEERVQRLEALARQGAPARMQE